MKRTFTVFLAVCMLLLTPVGCGSRPDPEPASVGEDTAPAGNAPSIEYDPKTATVRVTGADDYAALSFPDEIKDARVVEVMDDDFTLSAYLVKLRVRGFDEQTELSGLIDRTAKSLRFIRQYLRENAGAAYPSDLAALPVDVKIDSTYEYRTDKDRITLRLDEVGAHREFLYLLALMDCDAVGWEHLGYAWYVGTCINPYTEVINEWPIVPELPYYTQCLAGGVDPDNMTAADFRTVYDACARVCFDKGLTGWGSYCESRPVTDEPDFSRTINKEPGDTLLAAFPAASFLAWLDEAHGFEQLSMFCFGQKSFEEAFGTSFNVAYKTWRMWIMDNYPAE
ncbi:MAG: hypothetical protein IJK58_01995 [Clostridia bacterium]|nr:hypothetical protein [Clostridia bacterium]